MPEPRRGRVVNPSGDVLAITDRPASGNFSSFTIKKRLSQDDGQVCRHVGALAARSSNSKPSSPCAQVNYTGEAPISAGRTALAVRDPADELTTLRGLKYSNSRELISKVLNSGSQDTVKFFEDFEEVCGLTNNGKGMTPQEQLVVLKQGLHGSVRTVYDSMLRAGMQGKKDYQTIYDDIKARLLEVGHQPVKDAFRRGRRVAGPDEDARPAVPSFIPAGGAIECKLSDFSLCAFSGCQRRRQYPDGCDWDRCCKECLKTNGAAHDRECDLNWRPDIFKGYDSTAEEASVLLHSGGTMRTICGAKQSQKMAVYMMTKAKESVSLTGFTFDSDLITEGLKEAKQRGVPIVETFLDRSHSQFGATEAMMDRLADLHRHAVEVYLSRGAGSGGIQHSKTLFVDGFLLIGSVFWYGSVEI